MKVIEAMRIACIRYGYHDHYWALTNGTEYRERIEHQIEKRKEHRRKKLVPVDKRPPRRPFRSKKR